MVVGENTYVSIAFLSSRLPLVGFVHQVPAARIWRPIQLLGHLQRCPECSHHEQVRQVVYHSIRLMRLSRFPL